MKEFWIEISQEASPEEKDAILKLARESCDFILTDEKAVGKDGKHEISIIYDTEKDKIQKLKDVGKKGRRILSFDMLQMQFKQLAH